MKKQAWPWASEEAGIMSDRTDRYHVFLARNHPQLRATSAASYAKYGRGALVVQDEHLDTDQVTLSWVVEGSLGYLKEGDRLLLETYDPATQLFVVFRSSDGGYEAYVGARAPGPQGSA